MNRSFLREGSDIIFKMMILFLAIVFTGCASISSSTVVISPHYKAARIQRVALIGFDDYPGVINSGEVTAGIFEKYLLLAGYRLVERRQVNDVLKEQVLQAAGVIDPDTRQKLGQLLGVNALVLGSISDYNNPQEQTVMVNIPQHHSSPVYGEIETTRKQGDTTVKTTEKVITSYNISYSSQIVPQTEIVPAHVGISVRLVDVETGEVLWSASASGEGSFLNDATEDASSQVMQAVTRQLEQHPD